jgi:hypothetical protein
VGLQEALHEAPLPEVVEAEFDREDSASYLVVGFRKAEEDLLSPPPFEPALMAMDDLGGVPKFEEEEASWVYVDVGRAQGPLDIRCTGLVPKRAEGGEDGVKGPAQPEVPHVPHEVFDVPPSETGLPLGDPERRRGGVYPPTS